MFILSFYSLEKPRDHRALCHLLVGLGPERIELLLKKSGWKKKKFSAGTFTKNKQEANLMTVTLVGSDEEFLKIVDPKDF